MKRFIFLFIASIIAISCSKDDVPGITGKFTGDYYKISSSGPSDEIMDWIDCPESWPSSHAFVTVTISKSAGTMKILIDSDDFGIKRINGHYTENNGIYECNGVKITDGEIWYFDQTYSFDNMNHKGQIRGEYLKAYQY